jgi:hypothetical protein
MQQRLLASAILVAALGSTTSAVNITVRTRSYDEGRTGWNRSETI